MNSRKALKKLHGIVGDELYERICLELSGSTVYFVEYDGFPDKKRRNEQLRADFYSALYDVPTLAQKYNLSISTVYKIIQNR